MFIPLFTVALGVMGAVSAKDAHLTMRERALGPNHAELPDIFHPKIMNGEKGVIPSSTYSSTGWFVMNYYNGATCNNIVFTSGQVVNTCFEIGGGQSAKYQISSSDPGDCSTAMVEIFSTIGCTGTATTVPGSSFGVSGTCSTDTDDTSMSYKNTCSTNSNYNFGVDGAQAKSFTDTTCTTVAAYSAVVTDTCFFNGKVTCGSTITYTEYAEDGCMGAVTDTDSDATNVCLLTATQDDNDANTGSEYYSCSGAGASFLLDARVIAGLVIGGISLLAL